MMMMVADPVVQIVMFGVPYLSYFLSNLCAALTVPMPFIVVGSCVSFLQACDISLDY